MDIAEALLKTILPLVFFLLPLLIPALIVMRLFRFKDVVVKLMDEVRKNPQGFKDNPQAMQTILRQLQQGKRGGSSRPGGMRVQRTTIQSASRSRPSASSSSRGGGVLPQSGRSLSSNTPAGKTSPLRGTARMTQQRQEHKLKTTVAVLFLVGGVSLLFSTYFYGYQYEAFYSGMVLMGAGLFLLKAGVERV